ncbi:cell division activator CedA [Escherichia sp. TWPC-MK]
MSYVPRTEPAPPDITKRIHLYRMFWRRGFRAWDIANNLAVLLMGESFLRSPAFTVPESAQRWANQIRQEGEVTE